MLYTTRSIQVEAVQWNGDSNIANDWLGEAYGRDWSYIGNSEAVEFHDETGSDVLEIDDWLVKLPGEVHPRVYTEGEFSLLFAQEGGEKE